MITSFPKLYTIYDYGSLERFQAFKVDRADVTSSNNIHKRGRSNTPPRIGFNRRAKRLVIAHRLLRKRISMWSCDDRVLLKTLPRISTLLTNSNLLLPNQISGDSISA